MYVCVPRRIANNIAISNTRSANDRRFAVEMVEQRQQQQQKKATITDNDISYRWSLNGFGHYFIGVFQNAQLKQIVNRLQLI